VRVNASVRDLVVQTNDRSIFDVAGGQVIPSIRALDLSVGAQRLSLILHDEEVVVILVGVESDLLLLAASRVHVVVGVQVTTLGVKVTNADSRTERNIGGNVLHALGVQSGLEFGRHEAIALTRVDQAEEVDRKHAHVEPNRDDNQTKNTGGKVLEPNSL